MILLVTGKKQAINVLYETLGDSPPYLHEEDLGAKQSIKRDQFFRKGFAPAASAFLKIKGHACTAEEVLRGLEEGGFDFPWEESDRLRSVAISLAKNSVLFQKLPNNTFGLLSWYGPETQTRRKRTVKNNVEIEEDDSEPKETNIEDLLKGK